jgi:hypothetical protein
MFWMVNLRVFATWLAISVPDAFRWAKREVYKEYGEFDGNIMESRSYYLKRDGVSGDKENI